MPARSADDVLHRAQRVRSRRRAGIALGGSLGAGALTVAAVLVSTQVIGGPTLPATSPDPRATISYCVGEGAGYPNGSTVRVRFLRGTAQLGEVWIQVPMRAGIQVAPGPFRVLVEETDVFDGSVGEGGAAVGGLGANCPPPPGE